MIRSSIYIYIYIYIAVDDVLNPSYSTTAYTYIFRRRSQVTAHHYSQAFRGEPTVNYY